MGRSLDRSGDLAELPYGELLAAVYASGLTVVVELRRAAVEKRVIFEDGIPVDCHGNLLHETVGRFLVKQGVISEEQYHEALTESVSSGEQMGHVLLRMEAITAFELYKRLQQNLAHKLLDPFSWTSAEYRVLSEVGEIDSSLKINVPQLILTGIARFAPQPVVNTAFAKLMGPPLGVDRSGPLEELKLNARRARVLKEIEQREPRADELLDGGLLEQDELTRLLYALSTLGVVRPTSEIERPAAPEPASPPATTPAAAPEPRADEPARASVEEVMKLFLEHRPMDAFELLDISTEATPVEIDRGYQAFAARFSPWRFEGDLAEKAGRIFNAGAKAYAILADAGARNSLIHKRSQPKQAKASSDPYRIRTDLLDAGAQFDEGRALVKQGHFAEAAKVLAYAVDLDPQSCEYAAELAYVRFLARPETASVALDELTSVLRRDPCCEVAQKYQALVKKALA